MDEKSRIFIIHIIQNIDKIEKFSRGITRGDLQEDELTQYAIVRAIEVIGEAAKNLSESFKKEYPEINWKEIIGTRDIIIHKYFGIDLEIIWNIIKIDLPDLKKKLNKILK